MLLLQPLVCFFVQGRAAKHAKKEQFVFGQALKFNNFTLVSCGPCEYLLFFSVLYDC